jgi:hypothetical protein
MDLKRKLLILILIFFTLNCSEKTYFSGKVFNEDFNYNQLTNKQELIETLGNPNFIDLIENKYYYFNEIYMKDSISTEDVKNRTILVFLFENEEILSVNKYGLDNKKKLNIMNETTENNLIETGIIKKIFGGVSPTNMTNTP